MRPVYGIAAAEATRYDTPMKRLSVFAAALLALSACKDKESGHAAGTPPPTAEGSPVPKPEVADAFPDLKAVDVKITAAGFEPAEIPAKKGEKIAIAFTRTEENTCATEAIFDDLGGLEVKLPLNETVRVSFVVPKSGNLFFGCSMQRMIRGKIVATES